MVECERCLYTTDIPGISLDERGICPYCKLHDRLEKEHPIDITTLKKIVPKIKEKSKKSKYDCLIGVSGGGDSSYMLMMAKDELELNPLAVHFDNGWNTEEAMNNIQVMTKKLGVDLMTIKADPVFDRVNKAFLYASISDTDVPNDVTILTTTLEAAHTFNIPYNFSGHNFRTEGSVPIGWTFMSSRYVNDVYRSYWNESLSGFPDFSFRRQFKLGFGGIKTFRPLYYIDFDKNEMEDILRSEYGWRDYGSKHCENIYSAFVTTYLLPKKFGIDKRIIEFSALIRSGRMTKEEAYELLLEPIAVNDVYIEEVKKRLFDGNEEEFEKMMKIPRRMFYEFGDYLKVFTKYRWLLWIGMRMGFFPKTFFDKYTRESLILKEGYC